LRHQRTDWPPAGQPRRRHHELITGVTSQEDAIGGALRISCVTDGEAVEIRKIYDATESPKRCSPETGAAREDARRSRGDGLAV